MKKIFILCSLIFTQFLMAQGPGCPNVEAGPGQTVDCDNTCVNLTATFLETGETTSYAVSSIPFNPPSNFNGLANQLFVNIDDIWSGVVNLPFDFCFFNQDYNQLIVGANGGISFDVSNANGFNDWSFTDSLPNATDTALSDVNIFGAVHDIDPFASGGTHEIGWEIKGTAPCRTFVVAYSNVAHFSCNDLKTYQMMVLYEGTNTIEVYILDKPTCLAWNSGNAVIGIQNPAGTVAYTPPGRNTGNWSASIEAWRFTPDGLPNYVLTWYDGSGAPIGNSPTINVCPTADETYTAEVEYTNCNGDIFTDSDTVTVTSDPDNPDASFTTTPTCDGGTITITGDSGGTFAFNPAPGDGASIDPTTGTVTGGTPGTTYTIEYTIDGAGTCDAVNTESVTVLTVADATFTTTATCDGGTTTITGDSGGTFTFNPAPGDGASIDPTTGTVTGGTAGTTYSIEYTISGTCGDSSIQSVTALTEDDASFTMNPSCEGGTATVTGVAGGTFAFNPVPGDGASIDPTTGAVTGGTAGTTYTVEYSTTGACAASTTETVTVLSAGDASFAMTATCDGGTAAITGQAGGTFAFNPAPGDGASVDVTTGTVTGGTSGTTYTVEYSTPAGACSATETDTVTVLSAEDASFTTTATCDGGTVTITGDVGGTFGFNPAPGDGASINPTTGTVTGGTSGSTYTIEYTTAGVCPDISTQNITALAADDASFTTTATCDGGTSTITGTAGGAFSFNPAPGDGASIDPTTGTVTGGSSGTTYTIEYGTIGACAASTIETVTVLSSEDAAFTVLENCEGGTMTILGDAGGTFVFNPVPTDGASIDAITGEITGGTAGITYTVQYITGGPCPDDSFQNATVLSADDPSFRITATCTGGTIDVLGTPGGSFAFNPAPGDGATIDPSSGQVVGVNPSATYSIEYTTAGACPESSIQTLMMLTPDDASFTTSPTCDGGTSSVTGDVGGTFAFNPAPGDGASINGSDGTITGGTPGTMYSIEYTTIGSCPNSSIETVTAFTLPALVNPTPLIVCDDSTPDGLTLIDLNIKNNEISGNNANYAVTYYLTQLDANNGAPELADPYSNTSNGQIVFVRVEDLTTGCFDTTTLELIVEQAPIAFTPTPLEFCDPNSDGFGEFDLHSTETEITGGDPDLVVSYHGTMQNAEDNVVPLTSLYNNIDPYTQTIYVRIESTAIVTDCTSFVELQLVVHDTPDIELNPDAIEECDDDMDSFAIFDLNSRDSEILNTLDPSQYIITYYENQVDAEAPMNVIPNPGSYNSDSQIIWVRVEDGSNGCFTVTSLDLIVYPLPVLLVPNPLELCDDDVADEMTVFDLTVRDNEITGGVANWNVEYFETNAEAQAGTPAIAPANAYTNTAVSGNPPNPQTLFVRVTNSDTGCFSFTTLTIRVLPNPTPNDQLDDLELCDDTNSGDLMEVFDLTQNEIDIIIVPGETPTYHNNLADAEVGSNPIPSPSSYTNTDPIETIYVRVTNDITGCYAIVSFDVIVNPIPNALTEVDPIIVCEIMTDNFYTFDLTEREGVILNGQSAAEFDVTYHLDVTNAENGTGAIVNPSVHTNVANPEQIFVNITNTATGCNIAITSFFIEVQNGAEANSDNVPIEYVLCDDNMETDNNPANDSVEFDLSTQDEFVLDGQLPADFTVTYYLSAVDADSMANQLDNLYSNIINPQLIHVRVDNNLTDCYALSTLTLIVNPIPVFEIDDVYTICVNTNGSEVVNPPIIDTGLSTADYTFEWTDEAGNILSTDSSYAPTQGGILTVTVTTTDGTLCSSVVTTLVQLSSPPTLIANVATEAFAENNVIEASATGDDAALFEFSIDNGPWVSNDPNDNTYIFMDVEPGEHLIRARDIYGCGKASTTVLVMDYPLYFTPNSDGYNDTWQIAGISNQSDAKIFIFDRYGKLLKQLNPSGDGWDGTLNGSPLPSNDYWFTVDYREPSGDAQKQFKAHFTLKR